MAKSFEADATKALFELTAKSVMSPFDSYNKKGRINNTSKNKWGYIESPKREGMREGGGRREGERDCKSKLLSEES